MTSDINNHVQPEPHDVLSRRPLDLYGGAYDFPEWCGKPKTEYMLATIPRSGSTFLAMELWRTGVMGAPMEYLNPGFANVIGTRLAIQDMDTSLLRYWSAVRRVRTSPNGVFGYKMFVSYYTKFGSKYLKMLSRIAPDKVIFLTRSSRIDQAVSYSRAIHSGSWFSAVPERARADYDAAHISQCADAVQYQLDFWQELFAVTGAAVHHVTYESLLNNPVAAISGIADFVGAKLDPASVIDLPRTQIQRNNESAEWVERFKSDATDTQTQSTGVQGQVYHRSIGITAHLPQD